MIGKLGKLTRFRSDGGLLCKALSLDSEGNLVKRAAAQLVAGAFHAESFADVYQLRDLIAATTTNEALSNSVPTGADAGRVVTKKALSRHPGAVARTKEAFVFAPGQGGFALLDHDPAPGQNALSIEQLWGLVLKVCPDLASSGVIAWPSGSSCVRTVEGKEVRGIAGVHLYVMVSNIADIPRFGAALTRALWLAGHGRIEVSSSGSLLMRSLFDVAVHQPARLVFLGAHCAPGLIQDRGEPIILSAGGFLDTRAALPEDIEADQQAAALIEKAKAEAAPRAAAVRAEWVGGRVRESQTKAITEGRDPNEAADRTRRSIDAAFGGSLMPDWPLTVVDDDGTRHELSVADILADRARWHLSRCLDPIHPEHRSGAADGIVYSSQPEPVIWSLDDGGKLFRLQRQPCRIVVTKGDRSRVAEEIADALAQQSEDLYLLAGRAVRVTQAGFRALNPAALDFIVGTRCALVSPGKDRDIRIDPPKDLLNVVFDLLHERLPRITGTATMPVITADGKIVSRRGFDAETKLFIDISPDDVQAIPAAPSRTEAIAALRRMWQPFASYRFTEPSGKAAVLATMLTIPLRPCIDAAPGLFADSASQGSGKSKLIATVGVITRGLRAGLKPWTANNEAELEKFLLAVLRAGDPVVTFDNIIGVFRSAVLASTVADGKFTGRVLQVSETASPDARVMWLASGNQAVLDRDMATRFMVARIDTGARAGHLNSFAFDPVDAALADRLGIVRAAITLHRAFHEAGAPRADDINTRFAQWGRIVRQMVLWLESSGIAAEAGLGTLGDPCQSILEDATTADPDTESRSLAVGGMSEIFGPNTFTASDVKDAYELARGGTGDEGKAALHDGLAGLLPPHQRQHVVAQAVAWTLNMLKDIPAGGLKLVRVSAAGRGAARAALWRVVRA